MVPNQNNEYFHFESTSAQASQIHTFPFQRMSLLRVFFITLEREREPFIILDFGIIRHTQIESKQKSNRILSFTRRIYNMMCD